MIGNIFALLKLLLNRISTENYLKTTTKTGNNDFYKNDCQKKILTKILFSFLLDNF